MSIFRRNKPEEPAEVRPTGGSLMAEMALNSIAEGVLIIDATGVVKFANPAAIRMVGATDLYEVAGLYIFSVLNLEDVSGQPIPEDMNPMKGAIVRGEAFSSRDFVLVTRSGKKFPIALSLFLSGGAEKIITFRNIAQELEKESEQTEFISTASHEMRTPVASIEGYLGLALNPATATIDERARKYLTEAHEASQHLGRLFRDLLDITKLDDNRARAHLVPVELAAEVSKFLSDFKQMAAEKNIRLLFGTRNLSGTAGRKVVMPLYVMVDLDFLREIVNNLVENAIKYTPEGGTVWVDVQDYQGQAMIAVSDTGIGIAPEDLTHIFQKFYRADNSDTRTIGGTGLGLYIVKKRTEQMGGKVSATSVLSKGSNFYVLFPRMSQGEYNKQRQIASNLEAMKIEKPRGVQGKVGEVTLSAAMGAGTVGAVNSGQNGTTQK
ncbi:PAS domain-containing protein [Candidatus Saccharibacteria bacterium]|nr:PAS domain-containing protein [Candidatus Saccharibacteria bacterium]MBQ7040937.1 PAS domain-containing protein [Candidatus Saccharibacteria bacterium]